MFVPKIFKYWSFTDCIFPCENSLWMIMMRGPKRIGLDDIANLIMMMMRSLTTVSSIS